MIDALHLHITSLRFALDSLGSDLRLLESWIVALGQAFSAGRRLFIAGNGGSAAQAQHLAAELVGRYKLERDPYGAVALHTDTSNLTAIANDYGYEEVFARQLLALGREGDIFLGLSTSGASQNILTATRVARSSGMRAWALTGDAPNPLAVESDSFLAVPTTDTATIQEVHLIALHLVCEGLDRLKGAEVATRSTGTREN
jgi:D-sedoheptulose 7-phosphate isomerase